MLIAFAIVIYVIFGIALAIVFRIPAFRKWWRESEKDWHKALLESQSARINDHKFGEEE